MSRPKPETEVLAPVAGGLLAAGPSNLLPAALRDALIRASKVDPGAAPSESRDRNFAVDAAIRTIRRHNPKYFKQEN